MTVGAIGMMAKGADIYIKNAGTLTLAGANITYSSYSVGDRSKGLTDNSGTLIVNGDYIEMMFQAENICFGEGTLRSCLARWKVTE